MTRGQRRAHRRIWLALGVLLPLGIAAGLLARQDAAGGGADEREGSARAHDSKSRRGREASAAVETDRKLGMTNVGAAP